MSQVATRRATRGLVISLLVVSVDPRGHRLPDTRAYSFPGPEHCGWQDTVFTDIGYRSGLTQPGLTGAHHFLRDEEGLLADYTASEFQPRASSIDRTAGV